MAADAMAGGYGALILFVGVLLWAVTAVTAYQLGQRRRSAKAAARAASRFSKDGASLAPTPEDLAQALEERGEEISRLQQLLGAQALEISKLKEKSVSIVEGAGEIGRDYDAFRNRIQSAIDGEIWRRPLPLELRDRHRDRESRIPIIAVGNLKGGVGKTTIAANLGAYLGDLYAKDGRSPKKVLFIDLDFQGSLSATLVNTSGVPNENRIGALFDPELTNAARLGSAVALSEGRILPGSAFFDCAFEAADLEDRLLFQWVTSDAPLADLRLMLSSFLYSQEVQERFGAVLIDMPPRNTTFSFNALCAATHLIIPSKPDNLSAEAISRFVRQLDAYRESLWPSLKILGVVPNMVQPQDSMRPNLEPALLNATRFWNGPQAEIEMLPTVPLRASISGVAGVKFPYFEDREVRDVFNDLGGAITERL